jgi:hypothetical protein
VQDNKYSREAYRTFPVPGEELAVELLGIGGTFQGSVVDTSFGGLAVFVRGQARPLYQDGGHARLRITSCHLEQPVDTSTTVHYAHPMEGGCLYGLGFTKCDQTWQQLSPELRNLFNRRAGRRAAPENLIEAHITANETFLGILRDVSSAGAAFSAPLSRENELAQGEQVKITFRLPGENEPLSLTGSVAQCEKTEEFVRCGVFFDMEETEGFHQAQQTIDRFVTERLRRTPWDTILRALEEESSPQG